MKITKSRLRQIIMEELERDESPEPEPAPEPRDSPEPSDSSMSVASGMLAVTAGDFEGMAHAAIAAIVQLAGEAGVDLDISSGRPASEDPPMEEGDISLDELKELIKSELLG